MTADKGLGQHFLVSEKVVRAILLQLEGISGVLEIGPGPGVLTSAVCQIVTEVAAVEIDARAVSVLSETAPKAKVTLGDCLKVDLNSLLTSLPAPRALVSNMPYNITGPLLERIASSRQQFDHCVLMMQREVGDKILAQALDRKRGALSVCLQAQFDWEKVCIVPPGAFLPPPKVDSIVLCGRPLFPFDSKLDEAAFSAFVHRAFRQPRKTLANNLGSQLPANWLRDRGLPTTIRAHELASELWYELWVQSRTTR
jgi:16S rRNA (adenine1518-N6/adenine1519-N6)-dimethyltransferase